MRRLFLGRRLLLFREDEVAAKGESSDGIRGIGSGRVVLVGLSVLAEAIHHGWKNGTRMKEKEDGQKPGRRSGGGKGKEKKWRGKKKKKKKKRVEVLTKRDATIRSERLQCRPIYYYAGTDASAGVWCGGERERNKRLSGFHDDNSE